MSSGSRLALIACSLDAAGQQVRLADWTEVLRRVALREETAEGVRYSFAAGAVDEQRISGLVVDEQGCCSFVKFDLARVGDRIELTLTAPPDRLEELRVIFSV